MSAILLAPRYLVACVHGPREINYVFSAATFLEGQPWGGMLNTRAGNIPVPKTLPIPIAEDKAGNKFSVKTLRHGF